MLRELLRRRDVDQAARSAARSEGGEQVDRLVAIDDDNTAWLEEVVKALGWPGRSLVVEEGGSMPPGSWRSTRTGILPFSNVGSRCWKTRSPTAKPHPPISLP